MTEPEPEHARDSDRQAVLKTAKLIFGGSVVDCLVLDVSETGLRVRLSAFVPIPEHMTVQFAGGASFAVSRRWERGMDIGLELTGTAQLGAVARGQAWEVYETLRGRGIDAPLRRLRELRHFDDPGLAKLAVQAELAFEELEAALRTLAQGPD